MMQYEGRSTFWVSLTKYNNWGTRDVVSHSAPHSGDLTACALILIAADQAAFALAVQSPPFQLHALLHPLFLQSLPEHVSPMMLPDRHSGRVSREVMRFADYWKVR